MSEPTVSREINSSSSRTTGRAGWAVIGVLLAGVGSAWAINAGPSSGTDPANSAAPAKRAMERGDLAMVNSADPAAKEVSPLNAELQGRVNRAVLRGLEYLKSRQNTEDGSWSDIVGRKVHYKYEGRYKPHVGVTALASMAFLANGSMPGRGEYGPQIERGLNFVLKHVETNGFISANESRMYSHAFATLFLAEVYGMTGMTEVGEQLKRAISLIVQAQNPEGGWRYQPGADDADMSITVCQVMALRAAHNAGIHVPKNSIDQAIEYVKASYNRSKGAFSYQIERTRDGFRQSRHSFALTAAGVTALYGAGVYDDAYIENGLRYLSNELNRFSRSPQNRFDYYYGIYYGSQAAFQKGGKFWDAWMRKVAADLLLQQSREGYWRDLVGRNYATAMACVVLQIPYQYLPVFER